MLYLSNSARPLSLSRRCLTLLGTFAFLFCFQTMFRTGAQAQDHDRVIRREQSVRELPGRQGRGMKEKSNTVRPDSPLVPAAVIKVSPTNLQGWTTQTGACSGANTSTAQFVAGPATPPIGAGSFRMTVGSNGDSYYIYRNTAFDGVSLGNLTALTYSTYVTNHVDSQAIAVNLKIDTDNDGVADDTLWFEPAYQDATYFPSNPQGPLVTGAWQTWNALTGGWYADSGAGGSSPGTGVKSLATIIAALPAGSKIAPSPGVGGGIRLYSGCGAGSWDNFDGNVDNLTVGVSGTNTTYDFDLDPATLVVDDDGMGSVGDCNSATPATTTIQAAVNAANPGDTIQVCPGTYPEQVAVNKTLTVNGPQAGVDARTPSRGTTPANEAIVTGTGNAGKTPFYITASNVTVNGFTIEGNTDGNNFGFGILLSPAASGSNILNNIVQNNIIGLGLAGNQTRIEQNLFRNNNQPGPASGFAIYTDQFVTGGTLTNVVINENAFTSNDNGAVGLVSTTPGSQTNITVSNNDFTGNGNAINVSTSTNLAITGNNIATSQATQVFIDGSIGLTFTCNTVRDGATRGIRFSDFGGGGSTGSTVSNNNFIRNPLGGIVEEAGGHTAPLNAQNNYYGSPTGPTIASNPGGTGDAIQDADGVVVYQPFLTAPSTCAPAPPRDCSTVMSPFNVVTEFSLGSNPNCEFSYGYTANSGVDSPFALYTFATADVPVAGIDRWHRDSPDPDLVPAVFHNRNATTTTYGSVQQPANDLNLHPGMLGERSVVRFTAPITGTYTVAGQFEGIDTTGTTTDVTIVSRPSDGAPSAPLFADNIMGFGDVKPFNVSVPLVAGQIIDFSVGYGTNQTYGNDSTGLSAVISLTPLAAGVSVSGRVLTSDGRGLTGAGVTITGANGFSRAVKSGRGGRYTFNDVAAGGTYTIAVGARGFTFDPKVITVTDNLGDVDFTPSGGSRNDR